jgi:hypothetical protein
MDATPSDIAVAEARAAWVSKALCLFTDPAL